jgi:D-proline reductase (dithiol) PrdB
VCTIALLSTAGVALSSDQPFDLDGERADPWWGDPTFRILPRGATASDVKIYHLHINTAHGEQDLNCILPLQRLAELEEAGLVGAAAPSHYSFMGYQTRPEALLRDTTPEIIRNLKSQQVDVVILVPV